MSKQRAALTGAIFQRKGEAAPAAVTPVTPVAKAAPVVAPIASDKRKALTVKLDAQTYGRLKLLAFTSGASHQDLMERAVLALLNTEGIK
jgi:hypothetical protein